MTACLFPVPPTDDDVVDKLTARPNSGVKDETRHEQVQCLACLSCYFHPQVHNHPTPNSVKLKNISVSDSIVLYFGRWSTGQEQDLLHAIRTGRVCGKLPVGHELHRNHLLRRGGGGDHRQRNRRGDQSIDRRTINMIELMARYTVVVFDGFFYSCCWFVKSLPTQPSCTIALYTLSTKKGLGCDLVQPQA